MSTAYETTDLNKAMSFMRYGMICSTLMCKGGFS